MLGLLAVIAFVWLFILFLIVTPKSFYSHHFDRLTHARYRKDKTTLQAMLDNLRSFPDQWSINREGAAFPKEGAKQIYISYDRNRQLTYSLSSFGGGERILDGYFGSQFEKTLIEENTRRETKRVLLDFYPELNGTLMLK
jgi:hypothetical protein